MKIKVSDLTSEQLDEWVARARNYRRPTSIEGKDFGLSLYDWVQEVGIKLKCIRNYSPTSNPAQWAELIEEFGDITQEEFQLIENNGLYGVYLSSAGKLIHSDYIYGTTPAIAICRAVVASVYGEYVEVDGD